MQPDPSTGAPSRICSLLPSATEIIAELGLGDRLVGVSAECRWPAEVVGKPVVASARIDPAALRSVEIDELVRGSVGEGGSLYAVDSELVGRLAPDLIVTQDLCAVCAVSSEDLHCVPPRHGDSLARPAHPGRCVRQRARARPAL